MAPVIFSLLGCPRLCSAKWRECLDIHFHLLPIMVVGSEMENLVFFVDRVSKNGHADEALVFGEALVQ